MTIDTVRLQGIIERHRRFWDGSDAPLPIVGIYPDSHHLPAWFVPAAGRPVRPEDLDFARLLETRSGIVSITGGHDMAPTLVPTWEIPWAEIIAGSRLDASDGHLWPSGLAAGDADALFREGSLVPDDAWMSKLADVMETMSSHVELTPHVGKRPASDYVAATGHVRGASDVLAALTGHEQMCLKMMDDPEGARRALRACSGVSLSVAREMLRGVRRYEGGVFNRYGLWAPGPTVVYQEDAAVVLSPELYRDLVHPHDGEMARTVPCAVLHLHSACLEYVLPLVLELDALRCVEIWIDDPGPALEDLMQTLKSLQERKSLVLGGDFSPEQLKSIVDRLHRGRLYIQVSGDMFRLFEETYL